MAQSRATRAGLLNRLCIWLALLFLAMTTPVAAVESILQFDSTIKIHNDGSLFVVEEIRVRAEGRTIRHGIYRDFPIRYRDQNGYRRSVGFDVISVTRNGKPEPYFTKASGDHERIYMGDKDVFIRTGEHIYKLTYETRRQLRYFNDYDELYWNITGNKWAYPIGKAIARIELPEKARILNKAAFTGRYGDKGKNFTISSEGPASITFETTRILNPYEGLSVAVGWPKGVVPAQGRITAWLWRIWDNIGFVILLAGTFGVFIYFYVMWKWIGRDPDGSLIFPQFSPPDDLSPAAVSYLHYMGFKRAGGGATKPFIAALVSLAAKGRIIIDETGSDITVKKAEIENPPALPLGEKAMFGKLLGRRDEIVFKQSNHGAVQGARAAFKSALQKEHGDVFFKNNYGWFAVGLIASLLIIGIALVILQDVESIISLTVLPEVAAVGAFLLSMGFRRLWNWLPGGGSKIAGVFFTLLGAFILLPTIVAPLVITGLPGWVPVCGIALGVVNVIFFHLMRAPTMLGKQMMDAVEGFKLYLSVAEAERMNMNDAPDVTEEIFEKYLPYAIGLGVEKPWSKAFEAQMVKMMPPGSGPYTYHPHWYHGSSNWSTGALTATTAGLVSAVSAGMASASPPSSSGSSGGGGFSGGGGGGGGGGGW